MFYELRIYHPIAGQIDALADRIERLLPPFLHRHGFGQVLGQWKTLPEAHPLLIWMLRWPTDLQERAAAFARLDSDRDWAKLSSSPLVKHYDIRFLLAESLSPNMATEHIVTRDTKWQLAIWTSAPGKIRALRGDVQTRIAEMIAQGVTLHWLFSNQSGLGTPGYTLLVNGSMHSSSGIHETTSGLCSTLNLVALR